MPLESLATLAPGSSAEDVEELCATTGYSRFPVCDGQGQPLGYLHIKDVLETDPVRRARPIDDKWIRSFASVRDTDVLHDALESLQRRGAHMARVIDAEGRMLGLVTLEDVLEELVGEIRDAAHHDET
jgi:CBS domain containing-hemolysin-like protein